MQLICSLSITTIHGMRSLKMSKALDSDHQPLMALIDIVTAAADRYGQAGAQTMYVDDHGIITHFNVEGIHAGYMTDRHRRRPDLPGTCGRPGSGGEPILWGHGAPGPAGSEIGISDVGAQGPAGQIGVVPKILVYDSILNLYKGLANQPHLFAVDAPTLCDHIVKCVHPVDGSTAFAVAIDTFNPLATHTIRVIDALLNADGRVFAALREYDCGRYWVFPKVIPMPVATQHSGSLLPSLPFGTIEFLKHATEKGLINKSTM